LLGFGQGLESFALRFQNGFHIEVHVRDARDRTGKLRLHPLFKEILRSHLGLLGRGDYFRFRLMHIYPAFWLAMSRKLGL
jgi:hypothetical protein